MMSEELQGPNTAEGVRIPVRMVEDVGERIRREVLSWPGVQAAPHRFGGVEFLLGRRELGHLHGDRLADLPFPVRVREELVRAGKAQPHHHLPQSGWVSYLIRGEQDAAGVIALFRLAYDRAVASRGLPDYTTEPSVPVP